MVNGQSSWQVKGIQVQRRQKMLTPDTWNVNGNMVTVVNHIEIDVLAYEFVQSFWMLTLEQK